MDLSITYCESGIICFKNFEVVFLGYIQIRIVLSDESDLLSLCMSAFVCGYALCLKSSPMLT